MARPEQNNVDYFPHIIGDGKKIYYIEQKYGNDGYATWFKILETLAKTNYHYIDLRKKTELMFLAAKCKVSEEILQSIVSDLADFGKIDADLWKVKVVYSSEFIESIYDAYRKRKIKPPVKTQLMAEVIRFTAEETRLMAENSADNTQSKGKKSKVNKSKEEGGPPTEIEVVEFFEEKGFAKDLAQKAFEYYNIADWKDSKGNKVKNWKQKMLSVWMKNNNTTNHATTHNTESKPADSEKIGRVSISDLKEFRERRSVPTQSGAA